MNRTEIHINSYFSLETDLAAAFSTWPEFISGKKYKVELQSTNGDKVNIKFVENKTEELPYIHIFSNSNNELFQRALGLASYLLAADSDHLRIHRWK